MTWTAKQTELMRDEFFQEGASFCPDCDSGLDDQYAPTNSDYTLVFQCPKECGEVILKSEADPIKSKFRPWTPAEEDVIVNLHLAGETPVCPVDESLLKVDLSQAIIVGFDGWKFRCPRCRKHFQRNVPREDDV